MPTLNKTDRFINRAQNIHNYIYSYEKTLFESSHKKIIITCELHGDFLQRPSEHLKGYGCLKCGYISVANKRKSSLQKFIDKATIVHDNFYGYSEVVYKNNKTKIKIICPYHGNFEQIPNSHLSGRGCLLCGNINRAKTNTKIFENFVMQANAIHDNFYKYFSYENTHSKVDIECPLH